MNMPSPTSSVPGRLQLRRVTLLAVTLPCKTVSSLLSCHLSLLSPIFLARCFFSLLDLHFSGCSLLSAIVFARCFSPLPYPSSLSSLCFPLFFFSCRFVGLPVSPLDLELVFGKQTSRVG